MVPEAKLEQTEHGLVAAADGWFTLNLRDAVWRHADGRGAVCVALDDFEGRRRAVQFGVNPFVLQPGEPMSMYHWEADQEAFLVVSGEAVLIVEGEERPLRPWDFVHCPPHTRHVIVGCRYRTVRRDRRRRARARRARLPVDEAATRHGAGVEEETTDGGAAYASVPGRRPTAYREGWLPSSVAPPRAMSFSARIRS